MYGDRPTRPVHGSWWMDACVHMAQRWLRVAELGIGAGAFGIVAAVSS